MFERCAGFERVSQKYMLSYHMCFEHIGLLVDGGGVELVVRPLTLHPLTPGWSTLSGLAHHLRKRRSHGPGVGGGQDRRRAGVLLWVVVSE